MKQEFSTNWVSSVQPRKQRKYRHNAPLHKRQSFVRANLSPELRKRFGKRNMQLRKGDEVKVMRGQFKGKSGVIETISLSKSKIFVEEFKVKKTDGSEIPKGMEPSNLMITKLKLDDKKRQAVLDRADKAKNTKTEPKKAVKKVEKKPETKKVEKKPAVKKEKPKPVKKAPAKKPVTKKKAPAKKPAKKAPAKKKPVKKK